MYSLGENRLRICNPKILREDVMWHLHDATTSGHIGIYRTLQRASRSSYYWPGMKQCVRDYVKFCQICEERNIREEKEEMIWKPILPVEDLSKSQKM